MRSTPPVTASPTGAYWVAPASVPTTVSLYVALRVSGTVVTVIVASCPGTTGFGLNVTLAPGGAPVADSVTGSGRPAATAV